MEKKEIITERLVLRKIRESDAEYLFRNWASDPEVTKFLTFSPHQDIEVSKKIIALWLEAEKDPKTIRFFITIKGSDEAWGTIDVVGYPDGVPEIGYCLSRKQWGKGYMTEACKAFLQYLFDLGFDKVEIRAHEKNIGSNRVIQKCGFTFVGKKPMDARHLAKEGMPAGCINYYEIRKGE